jgi:hypothetical protein
MGKTAHDIELEISEGRVEDSQLAPMDIGDEDTFWKQFDALKNPHLADPKFAEKRIVKEAPTHKAAFLYWMQLSPAYRTDRAVAEKYAVSAAVVGKWRKSFNWEGRLALLLEEDAQTAIAVAKRTLTDDLNMLLGAGKAALDLFAMRVHSGEIDVSAKDFVLISQEIRAIRRELMSEETPEESGSGSSLDRIGQIMNKIGESGKQVLINALQVQIGGEKTSYEERTEMCAARVIQDQLTEAENVDYEDIAEINE